MAETLDRATTEFSNSLETSASELAPANAEVDTTFAELITQLEGYPIAPETEAAMGPHRKQGHPIDPGYFTKDG